MQQLISIPCPLSLLLVHDLPVRLGHGVADSSNVAWGQDLLHVLLLLLPGTVPALPKFTPSKVRQVVEGESRAYQELSTAYTSHNPDKLRKAAEQHMAVFSQVSHITHIATV